MYQTESLKPSFQVFNILHRLSHPGVRATLQLISSHFVWPEMNVDVFTRVITCLHCQRAKVTRHTKAPLRTFVCPIARFQHVHVDFVGPLSPSNNHSCILACIVCYSRWPELTPLLDTTAIRVVSIFLHCWVKLLICPETIITDRGHDLEPTILSIMCQFLVAKRSGLSCSIRRSLVWSKALTTSWWAPWCVRPIQEIFKIIYL